MIDARSRKKLIGVHPDLVRVYERSVTMTDLMYIVTEGLRSETRQRELYRSGASTTMKSRHLTGHAIDVAAVVNGEVRWDWPLYHKIAAAMKQAALLEKVPLEWGGDWKKFPDGPHFQLPWAQYPIV